MIPEPEAPALRNRIAGWNTRASQGLRAAAVGLASLMLAYAGALAFPLSPWTAMALPAGLALAAHWRGGRAAWAGALAGLLVALLSLRLPAGMALLSAGSVGAGTGAAHLLLRQLRFDARLERAADVAALAAAATLAAALPGALAVAAWLAALQDGDFAGPFIAGWATLSLGALGGAAALMAFDRSMVQALQRSAPGWRRATGVAMLLAVAWLLWLAPGARTPALAGAALFAPLCVQYHLDIYELLGLLQSTVLL